MDVLNRILELMKEKSIKQRDLTKYLEISEQSFTEWKGGRNNSYIKYINKIADFLNVSTDYLLGKDEIKKRPTSEDAEQIAVYLSNPVIKELYDNFLKLPPEEQAQFLKELQDKVDLRLLREQRKQSE